MDALSGLLTALPFSLPFTTRGVTYLHRVGFAGLTLDGCRGPGDWAFLSPHEVDVCRRGGEPQHADTPKQGWRMHLGGRGRMRSSMR